LVTTIQSSLFTRGDVSAAGPHKSAVDAALGSSRESFAQQLLASLEGYLGQAGPDGSLQIEISPQQGQSSGARQFVVTVRDTSAPPTPVPAPPASTVSPVTIFTSGPPPVVSPAVVAAPQALTETPQPFKTSADAYWAMQPAEVQQLRGMDEDQRFVKGLELSRKGYAIDTQIMLYGWDPYNTMRGREEEGYTWMPSAHQDPIPVAPGLTFSGLQSYDAATAPRGSILVSTAWAKGLEHTSNASAAPRSSNNQSS
jgi:hypothetical protein